ncbi:hypothetical protein AZ19_0185, partial [Bordetella bronchiseptica E012]
MPPGPRASGPRARRRPALRPEPRARHRRAGLHLPDLRPARPCRHRGAAAPG